MEDAMNRAEVLLRAGDDALHVAARGNVSGDDEDFGTELFEFENAAHLLGNVAGCAAQLFPLRARRQGSPGDEHQARLNACSEILSNFETDSAEPAGYEVNAAAA